MLIRQALLTFIGFCSGFTLAAGVFAFITMLSVIPRLAAKTNTASHIKTFESCVIIGGTIGNIIGVFGLSLPVGLIGLCIYGVFSGIFVGCLAMALAEMLKVIPIFVMRAKLTQGLPVLILTIAIAKMCATLFQFFYIK